MTIFKNFFKLLWTLLCLLYLFENTSKKFSFFFKIQIRISLITIRIFQVQLFLVILINIISVDIHQMINLFYTVENRHLQVPDRLMIKLQVFIIE